MEYSWRKACNKSMKSFENMSERELGKAKAKFTNKVGKRIREIREEKGISQEELANKAGFYRTYIGHLETGTYSPSLFTVYRICKSLDVEIGQILK